MVSLLYCRKHSFIKIQAHKTKHIILRLILTHISFYNKNLPSLKNLSRLATLPHTGVDRVKTKRLVSFKPSSPLCSAATQPTEVRFCDLHLAMCD